MKKTVTKKMPPLTFVPVGDYCEGTLSLDASIPLGLRKVRHELWQEWHRYSRIKLAAALAGDISSKRDAEVDALYAERKLTDGMTIKGAASVLRHINEGLSEYHSVILDHDKRDEAVALLTQCKQAKPRKKAKPLTLTEARSLAERGYRVGYTHREVCVTLTPENYNEPILRLYKARLAQIVERERIERESFRCKCAVHDEEDGFVHLPGDENLPPLRSVRVGTDS